MYNYEWDLETRGYVLSTKLSGVTKELRPVFYEELDLLGFNKFWDYPKSENPLMWAETRRYIYNGNFVAEAKGGGLFTQPELIIHEKELEIEPVDIRRMNEKNAQLMTGLVQNTKQSIYKMFSQFIGKRADVAYIAFSGGKDSLVLLDLTEKSLPYKEYFVVFSDTTMEISDTYKAIEKAKLRWPKLNFIEVRSHLDANTSWELFGPPSRTQRWCCGVHKSVPPLLKLRSLNEKKVITALVIDGVRAAESNSRSSYKLLSDGKKHSTQINFSPILNWSAAEVYLYIFGNKLLLNDAYRYGVTRVGCAMCPLSSHWREYIVNKVYEKDTAPFIDTIKKNAAAKFDSEKELDIYLDTGGWKARVGGRDLPRGGSRVVEQVSKNAIVLNISEKNSNWKEWIKVLGDISVNTENRYAINNHNQEYDIEVQEDNRNITVKLNIEANTKDSIKFVSLLKSVFNKTAYCVGCRVCEVECPNGALQFEGNLVKINNSCMHCEACLNMPKGCLVAKSLSVTMGGNRMSIKGINRYQTFGFRKTWLRYYLEEEDDFWKSGKLGKYQYDGFKVWLKEAELSTNNMVNDLARLIKKIGLDDTRIWAVILNNLVYNSKIINWYVKHVEIGVPYEPHSIIALLGDTQSVSSRENALASLKETFRYSPIGEELGLGICEQKGNRVISITRSRWVNTDALAILYSLYKFAEKSDGHYRFTLSYLCDHSIERTGISPTELFGIGQNSIKEKLQSIATDYKDFIGVNFSKDLDNIDLNRDKRAYEVLSLF